MHRKTWSKVAATVYKQYMNGSCSWDKTREKKKKRETQEIKSVFGLSLFLLKLKIENENTVAK